MLPTDMRHLIALALLAATASGPGAILTRDVTYPAGTVEARGFLAAPDDGARHPGVLVVPDAWGVDEAVRERARMLAGLGYTALVVDMFGEGKAVDHPRDAGMLEAGVKNNQPELKARFRGALKFLRAQQETEAGQIAAIGYGFGGNVVLQMARNGQKNLAGVASFYGSLSLREPNPPARITARLLVCNGAEDPFVRQDDIDRFQELMKQLKADLQFINHPDAYHGYTDKKSTARGQKFGLSLRYNAKADEASWTALETFLASLFGPAGEEADPATDPQ